MFCLLNQNHVKLVLVTTNLSICLFFLCWVTLVTRLKQFFLYSNTYPTTQFNLVKHIITNLNSIAFCFFLSSTSSFNDPIVESLTLVEFFNMMDTIRNKYFELFRIAPHVCQNYLAITPKSLLQTIYLQLFP